MGMSSLPSTPFTLVGRERELGLLCDHLNTAVATRGSLVLIGGEAGIGKTALAEGVCEEAEEHGALVLVGRCYDLTETPPYGPWVELFARYQPTDAMPALPAAFAQRGTVGEVTSQAMLFQQVQDFLAKLSARNRIVLLLDDLHWADPASLDLLRFLARSLVTLPLLVIATYRSDEITRRHPLYALLPILVREARAERLDLRPLDEDDLHALISTRYHLGPADIARLITYLQERAEGNPFFLGELLRTLEDEGALQPTNEGWTMGDPRQVRIPPLLRQVIDGRLTRLGGDVQGLLGIAAVIGQEMPLAVWGRAAAVPDAALLAAVEDASEAHVLVETPDGLHGRFAHALIREAVYESISPARRRLLHRHIGDLLAAEPRPDPDAVAMHFQRASDRRAVEWLVRAGERAQLAYAWLTAIERYEAALALLEETGEDAAQQGWLRYRIARLRRWTTPEQSIEYLDEALRIAVAVGDAALAAAARYTRGLSLHYAAASSIDIPEIVAGCDALEALPPDEQARLDLSPDAHGVPTITNPRGMLVWALANNAPVHEAIAMGEETREGIPRNTPLGELGWAHYGDRHAGLGVAYALAGQPREARAAFERARACFRSLGNHGTLSGAATLDRLLVSLPYYADRSDDYERLDAEAAENRRRASKDDGAFGRSFERLAHLPALTLAGRWAEAKESAEAALHTQWQRGWRVVPAAMLVNLAYLRDEPEEAWTYIRDLLPSGPQSAPGAVVWYVGLSVIRRAVALSLDAGDEAAAREWLETHTRWLDWSGVVLGRSEGQALWAQYYRRSGDASQAHEHAERALAHATEPRQPLALLAAHRLLGELDTAAGHCEDAEAHLDASLVLADACAAPYERALSLLAFADLRVATGEDTAAAVLLDEARAILTPIEAKPALARVAALAARLCIRPNAPATYPDGLSGREVEVLRLIATGASNQAIADTLSISVRTVERHITNLYAKIDVRGRADATTYALRHLT